MNEAESKSLKLLCRSAPPYFSDYFEAVRSISSFLYDRVGGTRNQALNWVHVQYEKQGFRTIPSGDKAEIVLLLKYKEYLKGFGYVFD